MGVCQAHAHASGGLAAAKKRRTFYARSPFVPVFGALLRNGSGHLGHQGGAGPLVLPVSRAWGLEQGRLLGGQILA